MKYKENRDSTEAQVFKSITKAEINNTSIFALLILVVSLLIVFRMFDTIKIANLSDALIDAQLNRNLVVASVSKTRLEEVENLPEEIIVDYAEGLVVNLMEADVKTYEKNHAHVRRKLNSEYNVSMNNFFDKWEEAIRSRVISQDWKKDKILRRPNEDGTTTYRFEGSYKAWTGTALYSEGQNYIEITIAKTEVTESKKLGIEVTDIDAPMMRGN